MISIKNFVFNAFQVNMYVLYNENKECILVDAACENALEQKKLFDYIEQNELKPICLISTHTHIDHVLGNKAIIDKYNIPYLIQKDGMVFLERMVAMGTSYGFTVTQSPNPSSYLSDGDSVSLGNDKIKIIYTPGHADGSICLYNEEANFLITGDVLFNGSIGRTDFPTGNHEMLLNNIETKLFTLPDDTIVYSGHGNETSIGQEKRHNPFFN